MHPVAVVLLVLAVYLGLGVAFAVAFVARGVATVDPAARGGTIGFRLLIIPGSAALWPLLARRWLRARRRACGGAP